MSEELPETADGAVRGFIALFLLGAILEGWSAWHHDEIARALEYWGLGVMLATLGVFWVRLRVWAGPRFSATAMNVATDFRWWIIAIVLIFAFLTFSPFLEQGQWPFSSRQGPTADQIADAVVRRMPGNSSPNPGGGADPAVPQAASKKPARLTDVGIDWNGGFGPITFHGKFTQTGEKLDVFLEWGMLLTKAPVIGGFINWEGRRIPIEFKDRVVRNAELKVAIGSIIREAGDQSSLQLGNDPAFKFGIADWGGYVVKIILMSQGGDEESYSFAMVSTESQFLGKAPHALIIDPAVFLGRGNT